MKDPTVLTTSDVARRLHVTPSTVFRWIKAGWLRSSPTAGRHNRIREEDLHQFMRERGMWLGDDEGPLRVVAAHSETGMLDQITSLIRAIAPESRIERANDAATAMLKVGALTPHMVVLDADMPDFSAEHACSAIHDASQHNRARVLVITRQPEPTRSELSAAGADAVLGNPFTPEQLLAELRQLVPSFLAAELSSAHC